MGNENFVKDFVSDAGHGTVEKMQYFIKEKGLDVNVKDADGYAPLHEAARYGNTKVVEFLVNNGAGVNITKNKTGFTPLHDAASSNYVAESIEIAKILISKGANVNAKTNEGNTPLKLAIAEGKTSMVEYFKEEQQARERRRKIGCIAAPSLAVFAIIMCFVTNGVAENANGSMNFIIIFIAIPFAVICFCEGIIKRVIFLIISAIFGILFIAVAIDMSHLAEAPFGFIVGVSYIISCVIAMINEKDKFYW